MKKSGPLSCDTLSLAKPEHFQTLSLGVQGLVVFPAAAAEGHQGIREVLTSPCLRIGEVRVFIFTRGRLYD